jgi:glucokinase
MAGPVGVDVGGTKVLAVAGERELRVPTPRGGQAIVDSIAGVVADLGGAACVGAGIAGLIDRDGRLTTGPNLPGIVDFPFRAELEQRLGVPVVVENDATCAMWAEHELGAARGTTEAVLVTLGTGIGGGQVTAGELQLGANGFAGEPGHMIVDPHGPICVCGRRGCWERFASGSGLARFGREAAEAGRAPRIVELAGGDPEAVRGEHVSAAARSGDAGALAVMGELAWWVALGVANLVNILDPEVVVIGGGLGEAGELLLEPVREHYLDLVLGPTSRPAVRILAAELGDRAGAVGAALLAQGACGPG